MPSEPSSMRHILVGDEEDDAGIAQQRLDEGDDDWVVGADEFDHGQGWQAGIAT
jgi:hypothetical protein